MRKNLFILLLAMGTAALSPAHAGTWAQADAYSPREGWAYGADTATYPALAGEPAVWALGDLDKVGTGGGEAHSGVPGPCTYCWSAETMAQAFAAVNASSGWLKAGAVARYSGGADAMAQFTDTLNFGAGSVHWDLNLDTFRHQGVEGGGELTFEMAWLTGDADFPFETFLSLLVTSDGFWQLNAFDDFSTGADFTGMHVEHDMFALFPYSRDLVVTLRTRADCTNSFVETDCSAEMDATHSAYLGLTGDFSSSNGYGYLGLSAPSSVPEPTTLMLSLLGLAALARRRGRADR
ncbi:MAG: PEP-CTERM sorting domain-containing protein [Propionivibrio sp.]|uniref:PEP-CTERM sorting domain-containing protein n=1 Tax=Propionivibrio sp. TaxID=2212460 RepID=UPI0025EF7D1B|nr:PEP-CTERM sorting domain-containing protein [Propionivibrio sp.]MBK8401881.1 PEP-CTERM sorting domain-containing protein [Propionivibrio sp.]MBK8895568.1 PEP-CTERM sorting domain-containing protein [Propionivibrio sp.]